LNAEDPDRDFAPAPGRIARLALPDGPGIRVDTGVSEGDTIPADFDSMIAKIIAYGRDRDEALGRLRRAMAETTVVIDGGATNKSFVLDLLDQPEVIDASADTGWIDRGRGEGRLAAHKHSAVALAAAAIEAYEDEEELSVQRLLATARGGREQVQHDPGRPLDLKLRGASYRVRVARTGPKRFSVEVGAEGAAYPADVEVERFDAHSGRITVNGTRFRLITATHGPVHMVEADAPILVLESMKMETVLRAPFRARVRECLVSVGSQVEAGAPLLRLEPVGDEGAGVAAAGAAAGPAAAIDLPAAPVDVPAAERAERYLAGLRGLLLGYDDDSGDARRALRGYLAASAELGGTPRAGEVELLTVFADMSELSRNRPDSSLPGGRPPVPPEGLSDEEARLYRTGQEADPALEGAVHSPREYFHSYLRSLDVERAGVPAAFQAKLERVFRYYDVASVDRTPELEAAVYRIFLAQQRMAAGAGVIAELLQQWLTIAPPAEPLRERSGLALEHLIEATQLRFPSLSDLARGVVFRWFAQPLLRRNRARVYAAIREQLRYLDQYPEAPDRADRIQAIVASSEPLVRLIGQRLPRGWEIGRA